MFQLDYFQIHWDLFYDSSYDLLKFCVHLKAMCILLLLGEVVCNGLLGQWLESAIHITFTFADTLAVCFTEQRVLKIHAVIMYLFISPSSCSVFASRILEFFS